MNHQYTIPEMVIIAIPRVCLLAGSGGLGTLGIGNGEKDASESLAPQLMEDDDIPSF